MFSSIRILTATALLVTASTAAITPAAAAPIGQPMAIAKPTTDLTKQVYWRGRGWGWGGGAFVGGLAAGALLAAPYYGGPYYYGPGYAPYPAYAPPPDDAIAYCMRRFRSYDPNSGTYLGKDGRRHLCP